MKNYFTKTGFLCLVYSTIFGLNVSAQKINPASSIPIFTGSKTTTTKTGILKSSPIQTNSVPSAGAGVTDHNDVHVFTSSNPQSEVHISINQQNPSVLALSFNSLPVSPNTNQGRFVSTDGGLTWSGSEQLDQNHGFLHGDPSTAIDANGNIYISTINENDDGYYLTKSTNNGSTFTPLVRGVTSPNFDKEMIVADNLVSSPYKNNIYCAWTSFGSTGNSASLVFNRSTDGGNSFSSPITLKNSAGQGTNVQTGPNGEVYVCYADYGTGASPVYPSDGLGFVRSTDGGATFTTAQVVAPYVGIRKNGNVPDPNFNNIRINDFPSMAVDRTISGSHNGRIYVVFAAQQNGNGKAVIELVYSDNGGANWSAPKEISIPNGLQNYDPWIAVDQSSGSICIAYYSIDGANFQTNTYVAISVDGGNTIINQKVSDVSHTTAPIPGYQGGYQGDYIGIATYGGKAYAAWMDDRSTVWQIYVSEVDFTPPAIIAGPPYICNSSVYSVNNLQPGSTVAWSIPSNVGPVLQLAQNTPSTNQLTITNQQYYGVSTTLTATITNGGNVTTATLPIANDNSTTVGGNYVQDACLCYNVAHPSQSGSASTGVATFIHMCCDTRLTLNLPANKTVTLDPGSGTPTYWFYSGGILYFALPYGSGGIPFQFNIVPITNDGSCSSSVLFFAYSNNGNAMTYSVAPNPVSNVLTVVANDNNGTESTNVLLTKKNQTMNKADFQFTAKIYDIQNNRLLLTRKSNKGEMFGKFDISSLMAGSYFVQIVDQFQTQVIKFIKN